MRVEIRSILQIHGREVGQGNLPPEVSPAGARNRLPYATARQRSLVLVERPVQPFFQKCQQFFSNLTVGNRLESLHLGLPDFQHYGDDITGVELLTADCRPPNAYRGPKLAIASVYI